MAEIVLTLGTADLDALADKIAQRLAALHATDGQPAYSHLTLAKILGISSYTLHEWRRAGKVKGCKVGKKYVYTRAALLDFLQKTEE